MNGTECKKAHDRDSGETEGNGNRSARYENLLFFGSGSILLREYILGIPEMGNAEFIESPNANVIGYHLLGTAQLNSLRSEAAK